MNLLGRIAFYFSQFASFFVRCWEWLANLLNTNPLLKEIMKLLGYAIIGFMIYFLIRALIDRIGN